VAHGGAWGLGEHMLNRRLLLGMAVWLVALAGLTASASAFREMTITGRETRSTSAGKITFTAGLFRVECNITKSMRITGQTIPAERAVGANLGSISRFEARECTGGEISAFLRMPRPMGLQAILPEGVRTPPERITGYLYTYEWYILFILLGTSCLYSGTVGELSPVIFIIGPAPWRYVLGRLRLLEVTLRGAPENPPGCPTTASAIGSFNAPEPESTIDVN
jgi:hypothetical protein